MILLLHHCIEHGYVETAERLQHEAGITLSKFEVADNIDFISIIQVEWKECFLFPESPYFHSCLSYTILCEFVRNMRHFTR